MKNVSTGVAVCSAVNEPRKVSARMRHRKASLGMMQILLSILNMEALQSYQNIKLTSFIENQNVEIPSFYTSCAKVFIKIILLVL